jgi:monoamine oxidase
MTKSKYFSRRDFLKASSVASAGLWLSGCTGFQSAFNGDKRNLSDEVVILGAGAAGLAAAYTLKKNKIPYRIFEASPRVGGRVYTLDSFSSGGLSAELGAEYFDESHRHLFQICKELNIEIQELKAEKKLERHLYSLGGKLWTEEQFRKQMKPLYSELSRHTGELFSQREVVLTVDNMDQYENALYYDGLSAESLIRNFYASVDTPVMDAFLLQVRERFGADPAQISALQLICTLNRDPVLNLQGRKSSYRVAQGNGFLMRSLYERVAGVIPDYMVRVGYALSSVSASTDAFEMGFKTEAGTKYFRAKQVICTLPFSTLRDVDGVFSLDFSVAKKELIRTLPYSTHTKGVLEFKEAFWKKKIPTHPAFSGSLTTDQLSQSFWDSGRGQEGEGALLANQRGGRAASLLDASSLQGAVQDLEKFHPGASELLTGNQTFMNWGQRAWQKGGRSYFAPDQYHKFSGLAAQSEYEGNFVFAGEHTSVEFPGTIEGALSSGIGAAEKFMKKAAATS